MKLRRILTLAFCLMMTVSAVAFTVNAQEENAKYEVGEGYISFDFNDITGGIVNGKPNATVEKNVAFEGKTAVIKCVPELTGAKISACDLRAGVAMIIAGLSAKGTTEVDNISHIERGYQDIVAKFRSIGADITKVEIPDETEESAIG